MLSEKEINKIQFKYYKKIKNEHAGHYSIGDCVYEAIKEALAMAEKSNSKSSETIFGMDSAYEEAVSKPSNNMCISTNLVVEMINYIKRLEAFEKSKWKYPDKGELPEDKSMIYFILKKDSTHFYCMFEIGKNNIPYFYNSREKMYHKADQVKAWTYAPVLEEA